MIEPQAQPQTFTPLPKRRAAFLRQISRNGGRMAVAPSSVTIAKKAVDAGHARHVRNSDDVELTDTGVHVVDFLKHLDADSRPPLPSHNGNYVKQGELDPSSAAKTSPNATSKDVR